MRIIVFFDLPVETASDRRQYRQFRSMLMKNGFLMLQESVYCRMVLNMSAQGSIIGILEKNKPSSGLVQILTVTEKQFANMKYLIGEYKTGVIDSDERLVIL